MLPRHQKWSQYKAHRPAIQPQLPQEVSCMLSMVDALGIPVLTVPGVEADDVCGSLAMRALHDGFQVVLVSPDKVAYCQLPASCSNIHQDT